jgi:asparagine synthase (glutamine-hydrolysing)
MCGISVLLRSSETPASTLRRMTDAVTHRGPDDCGERFFSLGANGAPREVAAGDKSWRVGLGHRRLAILDLSPLGRQPMRYRGRYWIVLNGEIYNYKELAAELRTLGHEFVSTSDTEVILAAFAEWDTDCFRRFRGMWALVLLDVVRGRMIVSRDRLGIKPLYQWSCAGTTAFVSEIKQLTQIPSFAARLDAGQGAEYLATGFELPGRTFFHDVKPVEPGTFAEVEIAGGRIDPAVSFWHPEKVSVSIYRAADAAEAMRSKFAETVAMHLRSDVPVGCALSGGLDSSSIAEAIADQMRAHGQSGFHVFSAVFPGTNVDESKFVSAVAQQTGAICHSVEPAPERFLGDLRQFVWAHDEPVGGLSIYAGYDLARLTHENGIKVTLNGQGGDELLAGYWQQYLLFLWNAMRGGSPAVVARHLLGSLLPGGNPELLKQFPTMGSRLMRKRRSGTGSSLLRQMTSGGRETLRVRHLRWLFLPRLLKWEDRNSMAFSVEGRYPFLDHELIDLCLSFDDSLLYRKGWVKWPLRLGLNNRLPSSIVWRRDKKGFEVPSLKWFSALRPTFESWVKADRPLWSFASPVEARRLVSASLGRSREAASAAEEVFRLFSMDAWMERFGVTKS